MTVKSRPPYLMNTETREIFAYSEDLAKMTDPKFIPFVGKLPVPDYKTGTVKAPEEVIGGEKEEITPRRRIEMIAGVISIVPKEDLTDKGEPGIAAVIKLTGLKGVKREEINAAKELVSDMLHGRLVNKEEAMRANSDEQEQFAESLDSGPTNNARHDEVEEALRNAGN